MSGLPEDFAFWQEHFEVYISMYGCMQALLVDHDDMSDAEHFETRYTR